jgi:hypothetical protein
MEPMQFDEVNYTLLKPDNMTDEECSSLPAYKGEGQFISKWKMSWKERLHCLVRGFVWVHVVGEEHPPILVQGCKTVFRIVLK